MVIQIKRPRSGGGGRRPDGDRLHGGGGRGRRLGHGAGYYDRFLPLCKKAVKIAAAFALQQLDEIICDSHDISMDLVVTEEKIFKK